MGSLTFHTPDELEKRIRKAAKDDKRTLSNWLRIVVEDKLEELQKEKLYEEGKRAE